MTQRRKSWRIVKLIDEFALYPHRKQDLPLTPKRARSKPSTAGGPRYNREVKTVQQAYVDWARSRGLTSISTYFGMPPWGVNTDGLTLRHADPDDFLGDAPADLQEAA